MVLAGKISDKALVGETQRLRAGMAVSKALELANTIKNCPLSDLTKNLNLLVRQLEEVASILESTKPLP